MARTNETPEQRAARTEKARATLNSRFASPEEKSEHYRRIAQRRWARRDDSGGHREQHRPEQLPFCPHCGAPREATA